MATESYLWPREKAIIELIEAVKIEAVKNIDLTPAYAAPKVNRENYATWYSIMENTELLLAELKKYVRS